MKWSVAIFPGKFSAAVTPVVIAFICAIRVVYTRVGRARPGVLLARISLEALWTIAGQAITPTGSAVYAWSACAIASDVALTTWCCVVWFGSNVAV